MEYLYAGKVDCIYIDPPYNTGARDWKYNNNYVDDNDAYRHSKWLSFMKKRLILAKKLLNPDNSVLIVTIDEREYLHLGLLLEQLFPESNIRMVSSVINHAGATKLGEFSRTNEFIFFLMNGNSIPDKMTNETRGTLEKIHWDTLRRTDVDSKRGSKKGGTSQFYPIFVNNKTKRIEDVGRPLSPTEDINTVKEREGCTTVWPIRKDGLEMNWGLLGSETMDRASKGYVSVGRFLPNEPQKYSISYLAAGKIQDILSGKAVVNGCRPNGAVNANYPNVRAMPPSTQWDYQSHDAYRNGTAIINSIFNDNRFPFSKSVYAVKDCIQLYVGNKKNALIVDFFAGSGTTLNAVNLLNAEDGGQRRCILVTNNEMTGKEADALKKQGILPGTEAYNARGIARYVTWPRTICSIKGTDINGQPLSGEYITSQTEIKESKRSFTQLSFDFDTVLLDKKQQKRIQTQKKQIVSLISRKGSLPQKLVEDDCPFIVSEEHEISVLFDDSRLADYLDALEGQEHIKEFFIVTTDNKLFKTAKEQISELLGTYKETVPVKRPMSAGFKVNAAFFQLGFLNSNDVEMGCSLRELLPLLWMKSGCKNRYPVLENYNIPDWLILLENGFAILVNESKYSYFVEELEKAEGISSIYLVTDSRAGFEEMKQDIHFRFGIKDITQLYRDYLDNFKINIHREG